MSKETIEAKVVVLGNTCVGKTSLAVRYCQNMFYDKAAPTVGGSFLTKTVNIKAKRVKLQIWDTAGQERFRSLAPMYYRGANAALIVFDLTDKESIITAKDWVAELQRNLQDEILICIVGNKMDLSEERQVSTEEGKAYADSIKSPYFEVSAKVGEGVNELFLAVTKDLIERLDTVVLAPQFSLERIDAPFQNHESPNSSCC